MLEEVMFAPRGLFKGRNLMTPIVLAYYHLGDGVYAELSEGEGVLHDTLYGVTIRPDPHRLSQCFFSKTKAMAYIQDLSERKPWRA